MTLMRRRSRMLDRRIGKFRFGAGLVRDKFETVAQMFALYKLLPIDVQYDVVDDVFIYTVLGNVLTLSSIGMEPPMYRFNIEKDFDDFDDLLYCNFLTLQVGNTKLKRRWKEIEDVQDKR